MADYPKSAVMFHRYSVAIVGNPVVPLHFAPADFGEYSHQDPPANGDTFRQQFYLAAGAYTLSVLGYTANDAGIVDWFIDGVLVVSGQDWYTLLPGANTVKTAAVNVIGNGQHQIRGVINGKNVASINFWLSPTTISVV